jgi:hypothetical protein
MQRHSAIRVQCNEGMSTLMVCRHLLHVFANEPALALSTHDNAVLGPFEVPERHLLGSLLRRLDGGLAVDMSETKTKKGYGSQ